MKPRLALSALVMCFGLALWAGCSQGKPGGSGGAGGSGGGGSPPSGNFQIPREHPRLFYTGDRLQAARSWAQSHEIDLTDSYDSSPLERDARWALHYLLHPDDPAATGYAKNAIDDIMKYEFGSGADSVDGACGGQDNARWAIESIIQTYDWSYAEMSDSQRSYLFDKLNKCVEAGNQAAWGGPDMPYNNYYWGYLRNSLEWGLVSYWEQPEKAQSHLDDALVTRWANSFVPYAIEDGRGGITAEGYMYGQYEVTYGIIPFVTLTNNGRSIYDETGFFKEFVYALIYSTPPTATTRSGGTTWDMVSFSDSYEIASADSSRWGDILQTLADVWRDSPVGQYARKWLSLAKPEPGVYVASLAGTGSEKDFDSLPLDYYAPGPGYFYLRNSWENDATVLALQLGYAIKPPEHQHYDCGTFQVWRNGRWLSRESTGYDGLVPGTDRPRETVDDLVDIDEMPAHNGILFADYGPAWGSQDGMPIVRRLESTERYAYAVTDLTEAYRAHHPNYLNRDDSPFSDSIVREFLYVRDLDTLIIFDRLSSSGDSIPLAHPTDPNQEAWEGPQVEAADVKKTFLLHSETDPAISAGKVTITNGDQVLIAAVLVPSSVDIVKKDEQEATGEREGQQWRTEISTNGQKDSYFLTVLNFGTGPSTVTSSVAESSDTYVLTLAKAGSPTVTITLNKGMASSGGQIAFDSDMRSLRTDVQSISVTNAGPVWGQ